MHMASILTFGNISSGFSGLLTKSVSGGTNHSGSSWIFRSSTTLAWRRPCQAGGSGHGRGGATAHGSTTVLGVGHTSLILGVHLLRCLCRPEKSSTARQGQRERQVDALRVYLVPLVRPETYWLYPRRKLARGPCYPTLVETPSFRLSSKS